MLHMKCGSCAVITAFRNLWKWLNHTAAHCAHGTLLLLCFTGNKAVIYGGISPQRYEVWWSLSMTEWLEFGFGWPQEGEKKKSNCCGFSASPKLLCAFTLTEGSVRRTLSYLATISARSWSSFTAASCSVSDAGETTKEARGGERREDDWALSISKFSNSNLE